MKTSVLLMVYIKPETTLQVINKLREVKASKIYISINVPPKNNKSEIMKNDKVKEIIKTIDWSCKIILKKRKKHVNAYNSYKGAIDWFFKNENEGIILEDDTLPNKSFFYFCDKMLKIFRNDKKISQICGSSFINAKSKYNYSFSNYTLCWGYATWKRSIKDFDEKMIDWPKLKEKNYLFNILNNNKFVDYWSDIFDIQYSKKFTAWDYIWLYSNWRKNKFSIVPHKHLIKNIGFVKDATHTKIKYKDWYNNLETKEFQNLNFKKRTIKLDLDYDLWLSNKVFRIDVIYLRKKLFFFKKFYSKIINKFAIVKFP